MPRLLTKLVSPAIAAALIGGLALQMRSFAVADDTTAFHARVKAAVEAIPIRIGTWDGVESAVPDAAGQLLRPNVLFARNYRDSTGPEWAKLIVIPLQGHTRHVRPLSAQLLPGQRLDPEGGADHARAPDLGRKVLIAEYQFSRTEFRGTISWRIYDFFVLPQAGFVTSMAEIQNASGDYRTRPYGAAQIQVIVDDAMPQVDRERVLHLMLEPLGPVIDQLQLAREGARP